MCETIPHTVTKYEPPSQVAAKELARLFERELNYPEGHIDPIALRLMLQAHWTRVADLAHVIHKAWLEHCA